MVGFLRRPDRSEPAVSLTRFEQIIQLGLRILGPKVLAQLVLAGRDRVARRSIEVPTSITRATQLDACESWLAELRLGTH